MPYHILCKCPAARDRALICPSECSPAGAESRPSRPMTVSLQTHNIKGLHENDFIMAAKLDRVVGA
jgi:pterin 4 alpha carbinolamine dehydratase